MPLITQGSHRYMHHWEPEMVETEREERGGTIEYSGNWSANHPPVFLSSFANLPPPPPPLVFFPLSFFSRFTVQKIPVNSLTGSNGWNVWWIDFKRGLKWVSQVLLYLAGVCWMESYNRISRMRFRFKCFAYVYPFFTRTWPFWAREWSKVSA